MKTEITLSGAERKLYLIAHELGALRDQLADVHYHQCAWGIEQTLRALSEAVRMIKQAKTNEPLPSVEDIQQIYREYNKGKE